MGTENAQIGDHLKYKDGSSTRWRICGERNLTAWDVLLAPEYKCGGLIYKSDPNWSIDGVIKASICTEGYNDAEFFDKATGRLLKCPCCLGPAGGFGEIYSCTTCWQQYDRLCSGKQAKDGRPILWAKGRELRNEVTPNNQPEPMANKVAEHNCRSCQRPNDVGVKTCWCCGGVP